MMDEPRLEVGKKGRILLHRHLVLRELRILPAKRIFDHLAGQRHQLPGARRGSVHEQLSVVELIASLVVTECGIKKDRIHIEASPKGRRGGFWEANANRCLGATGADEATHAPWPDAAEHHSNPARPKNFARSVVSVRQVCEPEHHRLFHSAAWCAPAAQIHWLARLRKRDTDGTAIAIVPAWPGSRRRSPARLSVLSLPYASPRCLWRP